MIVVVAAIVAIATSVVIRQRERQRRAHAVMFVVLSLHQPKLEVLEKAHD